LLCPRSVGTLPGAKGGTRPRLSTASRAREEARRDVPGSFAAERNTPRQGPAWWKWGYPPRG